ncbi:D-aminoacid aminotransferase-like PLP-dependent enzyme [Neoconidiobolus thromboides FSU 785]|nr:D-aminoacid aminotransferase-like PLP-dependent enzyme [Neoconidiobolus thromboides FSU 785]
MTTKNLIINYVNYQSNKLVLKESTLTPNEFYKVEPNGVYTGCRTVNHKKVLEYEAHCSRLTQGFSKKGNEIDKEELKSKLNHLTKVGLLSYYNYLNTGLPELVEDNRGGLDSLFPQFEAKLSYLIYSNEDSAYLKLHLSSLNVPTESSCKVELINLKRNNPTIKDTIWVGQRDHAEKSKSKDSNEVLLVESNGEVLEGLSSNFFVLKEENGQFKLLTAPYNRVLKGTIQSIVIDLAKQMNIETEFVAPSLNELCSQSYSAAFITSTSRLLLPIRTIKFREDSLTEYRAKFDTEIKLNPEHSIIIKLRNSLLEKIDLNSTSII